LHVHIWHYLRDPYLWNTIGEFLPITFRHPLVPFFEPLLVLGIIAAAHSIGRFRFGEAMLTLFWAQAAMHAARNLPIFALVATPCIVELIRDVLMAARTMPVASWLRRAAASMECAIHDFDGLDSMPRTHLAAFVPLAALVFLLLNPPSEHFRASFGAETFPKVAALTAVDKIPGRVFTSDEWADYILYNSYPDARVFMDGRSDFYGADHGKTYQKIVQAEHNWQELLDRYQINRMVLPVAMPLVSAAKESRRWNITYDDGQAIVFHRNDPDVLKSSDVRKSSDIAAARSRLRSKNQDKENRYELAQELLAR
jgi:hypothetical protein